MKPLKSKLTFLQFPLVKIILTIILFVIVYMISKMIINEFFVLFTIDQDIKNLITGILMATISVFTYKLIFQYYDKREVKEISLKKQT